MPHSGQNMTDRPPAAAGSPGASHPGSIADHSPSRVLPQSCPQEPFERRQFTRRLERCNWSSRIGDPKGAVTTPNAEASQTVASVAAHCRGPVACAADRLCTRGLADRLGVDSVCHDDAQLKNAAPGRCISFHPIAFWVELIGPFDLYPAQSMSFVPKGLVMIHSGAGRRASGSSGVTSFR